MSDLGTRAAERAKREYPKTIKVAPIKVGPIRVKGGTLPMRQLVLWIACSGGIAATIGAVMALLLTSGTHSAAGAVAPTPTPAPGGTGADANLPRRLLEIDAAFGREDWGAARLLIDREIQALAQRARAEGRGVEALPGGAELLARQRLAEEEVRNRSRYEALVTAVEHQENAAALALLEGVPATSAYRARAEQLGRRLREIYVSSALEDAGLARRLGFCEEVRRLDEMLHHIDPDPPTVSNLLRRCGVKLRAEQEERPRGARTEDGRRSAKRAASASPAAEIMGSDRDCPNSPSSQCSALRAPHGRTNSDGRKTTDLRDPWTGGGEGVARAGR